MRFFARRSEPVMQAVPLPRDATDELEVRVDQICQALGLDMARIEARASDNSGFPAAVMEYIAQGQIIQAIALYREMTGCGLKDAKDAVDAARAGNPVPTSPRYGLLQAKLDAILARVQEER